MFRGIATASFYADDIQAAKGWYSQLIGVEAYFSNPPEGRPAYVVTASVVDPFGNVIGIMNNPHYLDILNRGAVSR
jgi:hypothetical protein